MSRLCGVAVLVDEAAEAVVATISPMVGVGGGICAFCAGGVIMSDWNRILSVGSQATRICSLCGLPVSTCSSIVRLLVPRRTVRSVTP